MHDLTFCKVTLLLHTHTHVYLTGRENRHEVSEDEDVETLPSYTSELGYTEMSAVHSTYRTK